MKIQSTPKSTSNAHSNDWINGATLETLLSQPVCRQTANSCNYFVQASWPLLRLPTELASNEKLQGTVRYARRNFCTLSASACASDLHINL